MGDTATRRLHGLYAITDPASKERFDFEAGVEAALRGGATLVQYRDKTTTDNPARSLEAHGLRRLCHEFGALLIINDDIELALECGADGVHLGRDDASVEAARERLGPSAVIGWSCYNDIERARRAAAAGADYLAFGSLFPSPTKPEAVRAPFELFEKATGLGLPLCAIGGITHENAPDVVRAGADMLAVISGVFAGETVTDVEINARGYAAAFRSR